MTYIYIYIHRLNATSFYTTPEFWSHIESFLNCHKREAHILCSDDVVYLIHSLTDLRCFMHQSLRKKSSGCLLSVIYQTWFIPLLNPFNSLDFFEIMCCGNTKVVQKDFFYFSTICP